MRWPSWASFDGRELGANPARVGDECGIVNFVSVVVGEVARREACAAVPSRLLLELSP